MAKYSLDFKLEVISFYLNGNGYTSTANHFDILHSAVRKWVKLYQYHGVKGVEPRRSKLKYTAEFKYHVLIYMKAHNLSQQEVAAYFNIPTTSSILEWQTLFKQGGFEALKPRKKGRSNKMKRPKKPDNRTEQEKLIDQLQEELAYLRVENAVLKKFQEMDEKEERQRQKSK